MMTEGVVYVGRLIPTQQNVVMATFAHKGLGISQAQYKNITNVLKTYCIYIN